MTTATSGSAVAALREKLGDRLQSVEEFRGQTTVVIDRGAIRSLVENYRGVQARVQALHDSLTAWWATHAPRLADLPMHRELNRVRAEFLESFVATLQRFGTLDRFKLAGVIATWWTDTLPDFKTLLENGFPGVIEGWVDAIADAVEDDDNAGPAFDPFGHKLVRLTMTDYLDRIAAAKADIVRLKGEKEAFEQSNAPEDADEEELTNWNYAKDLDRQAKELKAEHRAGLKELKKLEAAAAKPRATASDKQAASAARIVLTPVLDQIDAIEQALVPYEEIKTNLSAARGRYRELTNTFADELKSRCGAMSDENKRTLVLELFDQDIQTGLDAALNEKRLELVRFLEGLWAKYRLTMKLIHSERVGVEERLNSFLVRLGYT